MCVQAGVHCYGFDCVVVQYQAPCSHATLGMHQLCVSFAVGAACVCVCEMMSIAHHVHAVRNLVEYENYFFIFEGISSSNSPYGRGFMTCRDDIYHYKVL